MVHGPLVVEPLLQMLLQAFQQQQHAAPDPWSVSYGGGITIDGGSQPQRVGPLGTLGSTGGSPTYATGGSRGARARAPRPIAQPTGTAEPRTFRRITTGQPIPYPTLAIRKTKAMREEEEMGAEAPMG